MSESVQDREGLDIQRLGRVAAGNIPVFLLIFAILFLAAVPLIMRNFLAAPFPGFFLKHDMTVSSYPTPDENLEIEVEDQLSSINGIDVSTFDDYQNILENTSSREEVSLSFVWQDRLVYDRTVTLKEVPGSIRITNYLIPYLMGVIHLGYGIWMQLRKKKGVHGDLYVLYNVGMAVFLSGIGLAVLFNAMEMIWFLAGGLAAGSLIRIALIYPSNISSVNRYPFIAYLGYTPLTVLFFTGLLFREELCAAEIWPAMIALIVMAFLVLVTTFSYRQFFIVSPVTRNKIRLVLWSFLAGTLPFLIWLFSPLIGLQIREIPGIYFIFPISIIPFPIGLALSNFRLTNIKFIFSRVVLYSGLSIFIGAAFALIVSGFGMIFVSQMDSSNLILNGILIFIFALAFNPLHTQAQKMIDSILFRHESFLQNKLDEFNNQIIHIQDIGVLTNLLAGTIQDNLEPVQYHIFLFDPSSGNYQAAPGKENNRTSELKFSESERLVEVLSSASEPLFLPLEDDEITREEETALKVLDAKCLMAIPGQTRLTGFVALGRALNTSGYTHAELDFLQDIAEISGLALERELTLIDLSRRVDELDVMTRVAQEVNLTLDMDTILDLIYEQTLKVIPYHDMLISLKNNHTHTITRVFVVQNNERRHELEQAPISRGEGLDQFVLFSSVPLREQDYAHACRKFNVLSGQTKYYAWLGVPLRAADDTIGAISIACRNPSVVFTEEHESILAGIADQASGAIIKAQLLQESESRANQMELLNEMSSQLTSTLQMEKLNQQILESAVKIIDCEAGSLLLVDDERGDMVFEEACGPVAEEIIGKRLAHGVGLVGKAIREKHPVMVNNVVEDIDWFSDKDEETGFTTKGLLVAPLISQDEVIGALEVINKHNSQPFDKDDQVLLSAFAAQAVIAMDNAKLYTLTDQALALRVEELSVMQRIDRELNTSLDLDRALNITLDWALLQTKADAGMIGMAEEEGIRIMAAKGYENSYPDWLEQPLRRNLYGVEVALSSSKIQIMSKNELRDSDMILPGAEWQHVVPIMREGEALGLILLEKKEPSIPADENSDFLLRLCDHAAIAISNAQLYSAVNQANIAKSDFVSFVSHELKTPMTSIKGYADLLAAGAVGEINEAQSNFLATIRSNVDRMSTLVSDLADVSRIEAGRLELNFSAVSMQAVIDSVVSSTQAMFTEKSQELEIILSEDLPYVWADQNRIVQVVTNLLTNASKYTREEGTIKVSGIVAENKWDEKGAPTVLHLQVIDNGIGIPEEDQDKIFQQYFRTESGKDVAQGTGLGLNITRYLVEMQGGLIWFESVYGEGSTFHVTIPVTETSPGQEG